MSLPKFKRLPNHVGIIPDGNRRWAEKNGLPKEVGYERGIPPGLELYKLCCALGIPELTFYGFTQDNTKRPAAQKAAFQAACVESVKLLSGYDASLLVVGNSDSPCFPPELVPYTKRVTFGTGRIRVNFLVNYGWQWDLNRGLDQTARVADKTGNILECIASSDVSRVDLIIRWGGRRRLSGFLPVQSIYSDFYVVDDYWPDFKPEQFYAALRWYQDQDVTLGG